MSDVLKQIKELEDSIPKWEARISLLKGDFNKLNKEKEALEKDIEDKKKELSEIEKETAISVQKIVNNYEDRLKKSSDSENSMKEKLDNTVKQLSIYQAKASEVFRVEEENASLKSKQDLLSEKVKELSKIL